MVLKGKLYCPGEVDLLAHASHNFPPDIPLFVTMVNHHLWNNLFSLCKSLFNMVHSEIEHPVGSKSFFFCIMNHVLLLTHLWSKALQHFYSFQRWFIQSEMVLLHQSERRISIWSIIIPVAIAYCFISTFQIMLLYHFYPNNSLIFHLMDVFLLFKCCISLFKSIWVTFVNANKPLWIETIKN